MNLHWLQPGKCCMAAAQMCMHAAGYVEICDVKVERPVRKLPTDGLIITWGVHIWKLKRQKHSINSTQTLNWLAHLMSFKCY